MRTVRRTCTWILLVTFTSWTLAEPATLSSEQQPVYDLIEKSFSELFDRASEVRISVPLIELIEKEIEAEKEREKEVLKSRKRSIEAEIDLARNQLKQLNRSTGDSATIEAERKRIHCRILKLEKEVGEVQLGLSKGLDVTYDIKLVKLRILKEWPGRYVELLDQIDRGVAVERKFGDYPDIGFRGGVFEDQADDVERGREIAGELKRQGLLPPEVEDEQVVSYVRGLANQIARNSDLKVPLTVTVLTSREVNAFALPGGFLYIEAGLLSKTGNETELAGVIAHEISHITARHGKRLMTRANIASIIFQASQIAAMILTGGVVSIATYYALQYGFFGLGLLLELSILGVSRDFELEADILGTQYLWKAGYDTHGFVDFFGRMAQEKGYLTGLSWFRTHPPFYERMERTYEEIALLPQREEAVIDSTGFERMKHSLERIMREMKERDKDAPTLKRVYDCDDEIPPTEGVC